MRETTAAANATMLVAWIDVFESAMNIC